MSDLPDDRQIRLLRDFAKRIGSSLESMTARDAADTLEALSLILPMADAEAVADQARHAAVLVREGAKECALFAHMLSQL